MRKLLRKKQIIFLKKNKIISNCLEEMQEIVKESLATYHLTLYFGA